MKHSFSVRRSLGVVLLHLGIAAFVGTATPQQAQAEIAKARSEPASISDLVNEIRQFRARGDLNAALAAAKRIVDLVERQEGRSGVNYTKALLLQADILYDLGEYRAAEPLLRRAVALNTELRGEKHPDTIFSLSNLAANLYRQGRFAELKKAIFASPELTLKGLLSILQHNYPNDL